MLSTTAEASAARSEETYSTLTTTLQLFITRWSEGIRDVSKLIASEAEATRDHITLKTDDIKNHITTTAQSEVVDRETKEKQEKMLKTLWFPEINARENMIGEASRETVDWILGENKIAPESSNPKLHDAFIDWLQSNESLFWLNGKPGSGKSTLMKFLVHDARTRQCLEQNNTSVYIGHYFSVEICTNPLQKQIRGCLRTLLHQIYQLNPIILDDTMKNNPLLAAKLSEDDWSITDLQQVLFQVVGESTMTYCFFIDGLDEIEPMQQQSMVDLLIALGSFPRVKICASSRPEPLFQRTFNTCPGLKVEYCSLPGIELYVQAHLKKHRDILSCTDSDFEEICNRVVEKSDCVFLWVVLVVQSLLRGALNGDNRDTLIRRIDRFPSDIHQLYQQILSRQNPDKELYEKEAARLFRTVLLFVGRFRGPYQDPLFFKLPLVFVLAATSTAAATEWETLWLQKKLPVTNYDAWVFARTAGLLEIVFDEEYKGEKHHTIRFIHRSVREFLVNTNEGQTIISKDTSTEYEKWFMALKGWMFWSCFSTKYDERLEESFSLELIRIATRGIISLQLNVAQEIELLSECKRLLQLCCENTVFDSEFCIQAATFGNAAYLAHVQEDLYEFSTQQAKNKLLYDICRRMPPDHAFNDLLQADWEHILPYQDVASTIWIRSVSTIKWLLQAGSDPHALFPSHEETQQIVGSSLKETAYLHFLYGTVLEVTKYHFPPKLREHKELFDSIKAVFKIPSSPTNCDVSRLTVFLRRNEKRRNMEPLSDDRIPIPDRDDTVLYRYNNGDWILGFAIGARWLLTYLAHYVNLDLKYDGKPPWTYDEENFSFIGLYHNGLNPPWRPADTLEQECVQKFRKTVETIFGALFVAGPGDRSNYPAYFDRLVGDIDQTLRETGLGFDYIPEDSDAIFEAFMANVRDKENRDSAITATLHPAST